MRDDTDVMAADPRATAGMVVLLINLMQEHGLTRVEADMRNNDHDGLSTLIRYDPATFIFSAEIVPKVTS